MAYNGSDMGKINSTQRSSKLKPITMKNVFSEFYLRQIEARIKKTALNETNC